MFDFIVLSPAGPPDATLAIAGSRAGAIGVLNLEFCADRSRALEETARLSRLARGRWGVQVESGELLATVLGGAVDGLDVVLVAPGAGEQLRSLVDLAQCAGRKTYAVVRSLDQAVAAHAAGADAVIAKGHEAGGWIGEEGSFVLLQRLLDGVDSPVWAQGGVGLHTAAAPYVAGAAGAVLDGQVLLARESSLPHSARSSIESMDGSETATLGSGLGTPFRVYSRPGLAGLDDLREAEGDPVSWRALIRKRVADGELLAIGQDAAFAPGLARRFRTVGGVIGGLRDAVRAAVARRENPLAEGSPLAESHGTRYPLVQGPMTRVSDRAEFAAAVADGGALPFLALALMRAPEVDGLLERTAQLLGDRPWGVGILGFVPQELRTEQLEVVHKHHPPFALIAGGRPDQARALEDQGISTYLHVPSPGLLKLYLADGARRFVFEGRECGGHVGPRTSFVLWDTMLRTLLDELPGDTSDCHVLLAGGIHDARSAAMAGAAAAQAAERGVRVGALLGTAYLFTREAVDSGAITRRFQAAAMGTDATVLLESGPGHATRCAPSPFVDQFEAEKRRLNSEGVGGEELRGRLEQLNIGRLRIASKGADRNPHHGEDPNAPKLVEIAADEQWQRGMYMIGQVAALRDRVTTLSELHAEVSDGSTELLGSVEVPAPADTRGAVPPPADVAIVGLGCILPGAADVATFWANILGKVDAIGEVPPERWDWRRYYDPDPAVRDKVYSRWGGFIEDVPFDPMAFGLPPKSLGSIEPFQLLALLAAQAALRDAGYDDRAFDRERTSVMLGAGGGGADLAVGYTVRSALPMLFGDATPEQVWERLPEWTEDSFAGLLMNVAAGRIANRLDLGGANYTVDAACASSLAAVGLGVRELQAGTSDMALAGGVDAIQNPFAYLCFSKTHALSPNGRCRPFDAAADGIAISEGFATVVLKRLADAERDGDRIYAVIRGVGAASDGRDRSLTAPRPEGQMRALRRAYAQARISPASVGLVEAHGTGTVAGDGAEVQALSRVFADETDERQWCAIGSVKSMIGHTKATAGVAGVLKAALALHHRVLPPTINVSEPNPKADFPASPFYVNSEPRPWLAQEPRRAGVSAFGFGGTDFHLVLEEYTGEYVAERPSAVDRRPAELLLWRGSRSEIRDAVDSLADRLALGAEPRLCDLALTLGSKAGEAQHGQPALAIVAESLDHLRAKLSEAHDLLAGGAERLHTPSGIHWSERPLAAEGQVAFLFPGQGSQSLDMGGELAIAFEQARETFEFADRVLADRYEQPLSRFIFPPPQFSDHERQRRQEELTETHVAQAALGATELAYLRVLERLGIQPEMAAGHSYGEFAALASAGCVADDELLRLSEARGRFMREAAAASVGAMAAVDSAPGALVPLLEQCELVAANLNAPEQTVLSGPRDQIDAAMEWCRAQGMRARVLPVACAFHSPHVGPAQRRLAELLERTPLAPPRIPVFSNTTGDAHADDPDAIRRVLAEHLIRPVNFVREVESMYRDGARLFVEVGPRAVLSGLVGQILGEREHVVVPVDRAGRPALAQLVHCLAALAAEGVPVRVEELFRGRSAQSIDLLALGREERPEGNPAGRWVVNGGRARPADAPDQRPEPIVTRHEEQSTVAISSTNGGGALVPAAPPPPLAAPAAMPPTGDRVGDVMSRYQQVMQQFLETESAVMLAYLGAPRPAPAARPMPPPAAQPTSPAPQPAPAPPAQPPTAQAAPATVPQPAAGNGHAVLTREDIEQRLLSVVSERTGYPADMLGLDADLEGDLGIDSIKRVEIAGTLTQSLALPDGGALDIERLTASRTLREVVDTLEAAAGDPLAAAAAQAPAEQRPFEDGPADEERIGRFVVQPVSAPALDASAGLADRGTVVIIDDEDGVGAAVADELAGRKQPSVLLDRASVPEGSEQMAGLAEQLREEHGGVKALVYLAPHAGPAPLLLLVQGLREQLEAAAGGGGAAVLGATRLGGAFGVEGSPLEDPVEGAVPGFLKTLALEWPLVRVKAVDLSPAAPPELAAEQLVGELYSADGLVEVGYRDRARTQLGLAPAPLDDRHEHEPITGDSVLLVTGGARGITAEAALSIASRYRPTLVLVGRTPLAEEELASVAIMDVPELRRALIETRRATGADLTPARVEEELRQLLRGRELRDNLSRLRATGARIEYLSCDVSDADAFAALIDEIYERHGRIDGVIHGAGVIEDRLVRDKRLDSLARVMQTKAGAALTLARKLRPEQLRFLVLFSSVSGRFGNRGQADYAAASEVLGRLAHQLDRRWPARVVSIAWGPWRTSGMVSPELEREFARRGVALIPVEQGCRMLDEELRRGRKGEAEVVIGAATGLAAPAARQPLLREGEQIRKLELARDRFLDDHRVDGHSVLPFAVAMELMAEAAALTSPGTEVSGLREIRLLHGVTVDDDDGATVRISAATGEQNELQVTIADADGDRRHYSAVVELGTAGADEGDPPPLDDLAPFPMGVDDAYRELLFHGPLFQGIGAIEGMDERGIVTLLRPSRPGPCVAGAEGLEWLIDPVLLDSALQAQVIWARLQWDVTLLPAEIGSYRRIRPVASAAGGLVRHEMRVRSGSRPPMCHADHRFRTADGRLLATLGDVVGVGTQALNRLAAARA